jgi:hypothetical protein
VAMEPRKVVVLVGLIRVREHCTFTWEEPEGGGRRSAQVRETHCSECVATLRELEYRLVSEDQAAR